MSNKHLKCVSQRPRVLKNVKNYFQQYCSYTAIHGFRYFSEKDRTFFEKLWWFLAFSLSACTCLYFISETYTKWDENAIIISRSNIPTPFYEIPFPAVTICPKYEKFENKTCEILLKKHNFDSGENKEINFKLIRCQFGPYECDNAVTPIITKYGICLTFNILDREDFFRNSVEFFGIFHKINVSSVWDLETGYRNNEFSYVYPFRPVIPGTTWALKLSVTPTTKILEECEITPQNFEIFLHKPSSFPISSNFILPQNESLKLIAVPSITATSNSAKKYSLDKRRCYFQSERHLKYFRTYTAENCAMECILNHTLSHCMCVHPSMPRDNETRVCSIDDHPLCKHIPNFTLLAKFEKFFNNNKNFSYKKSRETHILQELSNLFSNEGRVLCDCLPSCYDIKYDVLDGTNVEDLDILGITENSHWIRQSTSNLMLFFNDFEYVALERKELYGPTDFFANFGGFLGLFCGFSVLSLVEILYFLTVRIVCNRCLFGNWVGEPLDSS